MMKAFLFAAALILIGPTASGQVVFQSDLESWTFGVPDGMIGTRTDYPLEQLAIGSENVHSGTQAMRLNLGVMSEKQLTTAPVSVASGQLYDIRFWVRGTGQIRTGLYDGRTTADGYAPFNEVITVTDSVNWQLIVSSVYAENATDQAEFVFAVEGTADLSHLVIDDIIIVNSTLDPVVASIAEIQSTEDPLGISPLNFQLVRTHGVVTGIGNSSYFIQDGDGAWNGIYVNYPPPDDLAIGDSITVMATVQEVEGLDEFWDHTLTQLIVVEQFILHSTAHPLPEPPWLTAFDAADERWEGVLIRIASLECLEIPLPIENQWQAANWQGTTKIDDLLYPTSPTVGSFYNITGIAHYSAERKILPRSAADLEGAVGVNEMSEAAINIFPNPADDHVTLDIPDLNERNSYSLMDATGRVVLADQIMQQPVTVNTAELMSGLYTIVVRNAGVELYRTIAVHH